MRGGHGVVREMSDQPPTLGTSGKKPLGFARFRQAQAVPPRVFARKFFGFSEPEVLRKLLGLAVFFEELSARRYEFLRAPYSLAT